MKQKMLVIWIKSPAAKNMTDYTVWYSKCKCKGNYFPTNEDLAWQVCEKLHSSTVLLYNYELGLFPE